MKIEHQLLPEVVKAFAEDKVKFESEGNYKCKMRNDSIFSPLTGNEIEKISITKCI